MKIELTEWAANSLTASRIILKQIDVSIPTEGLHILLSDDIGNRNPCMFFGETSQKSNLRRILGAPR